MNTILSTDLMDQWSYLGYTVPLQREPSLVDQHQTNCLVRSIAKADFTLLQKYLKGEDLANEPAPQPLFGEESLFRKNIQLLVRVPIPETRSVPDIIETIGRARIQVSNNLFIGTGDKLQNTLVGATLFHITDITLIPHAALRTPEKFPGERLDRWKRRDEPRGDHFNPDARAARFSEKPLPPHKAPCCFHNPSALTHKEFKLCCLALPAPNFADPTKGKETLPLRVLLEGDTQTTPSTSFVKEVLKKICLEKAELLKQEKIRPSPKQIREEFLFKVLHFLSTDTGFRYAEAEFPEDIKKIYISALSGQEEESSELDKFLVCNISRILREALSLLKKPLHQATPEEIENILTLVPVKAEQELRLCFPQKISFGICFNLATKLNNTLWTMNVGDAKVLLLHDGQLVLLTEETSPLTHAFGSFPLGQTTPRGKVIRFPWCAGTKKLIVHANAYFFEKHTPREVLAEYLYPETWNAFVKQLYYSKNGDKIAGSFIEARE